MRSIKDLKCILVVEDDLPTLVLTKRVIQKSGLDVEVMTASNGKDGIEYLTQTGKYSNFDKFIIPDVILLDINMPVMNGWEFLEEYNKLDDEFKSHLIIAMITTSMNPDDRQRAIKLGLIHKFFTKPFNQTMFEEILKDYFE